MKSKTFGFIFRHTPTQGFMAKEGLDALLAAAAFEQNILAIFLGDGVWQLHEKANPTAIDLPPLTKQLDALPLYGVESLYVHKASATSRGIQSNNKHIVWIDDVELNELLTSADQVLSF